MVEKLKKRRIGQKYPFHQPIRRQHSDIRRNLQKNIADWCSNDLKILVTPSFFVTRPFLLTSLLIYIYLPTSKKMATIGTLPSRFSDKNQQIYKRSLIRACT